MSEEAKPEIGEWQASDDGSHIYSDDFTFDAMLVLSGNFGSVAKRKRYADQIARSLNEITALRAALAASEKRATERGRQVTQALQDVAEMHERVMLLRRFALVALDHEWGTDSDLHKRAREMGIPALLSAPQPGASNDFTKEQ